MPLAPPPNPLGAGYERSAASCSPLGPESSSGRSSGRFVSQCKRPGARSAAPNLGKALPGRAAGRQDCRNSRGAGIALGIALTLAAGCHGLGWMFRPPPQTGSVFPNISRPAIHDPASRRRLGLADAASETMTLDEIRAPLVLLYLFSPGCPACRVGGEQIRRIAESLGATSRERTIQVLGIALGASPGSAAHSRALHRWPFPVWPDPNLKLRRMLGRVGTPWFYALRRTAPGKFILLAQHAGTFAAPAEVRKFVEHLEELAAGGAADSPTESLYRPCCRCCRGLHGGCGQ